MHERLFRRRGQVKMLCERTIKDWHLSFDERIVRGGGGWECIHIYMDCSIDAWLDRCYFSVCEKWENDISAFF